MPDRAPVSPPLQSTGNLASLCVIPILTEKLAGGPVKEMQLGTGGADDQLVLIFMSSPSSRQCRTFSDVVGQVKMT
jgi:hypothetical protein